MTNPKVKWTGYTSQFPRLLAEIRAVSLTKKQYKELGEAMDLTRDEIDEVLEWAEKEWQDIKNADLPPHKRVKL